VRIRTAAIVLPAVALLLAAQAAARPHAVPKHYTFSFTVAGKPDLTDLMAGFPRVKVTGSGQGSFSIAHRQVDRDGSIFWDVVRPRGSLSLSMRGRVFASGKIVGGHYGTSKVSGHLSRSVSLDVRLASSRFRCAKPQATLGLGDSPLLGPGYREDMSFHACKTSLQWTARPPALTVKIRPA
jgi:hypothetical protein